MKRKTLFKILTLFLTFVIFSCCSGCFYSLVMHNNEKKLQKALEIQKQKKASADALIPEIEGYAFEARPYAYFSSKEDIESQGFKSFDDFFRNGDVLFQWQEKQISENRKSFWIYPYAIGKHDVESIGYVIPTEKQEAYFELFPSAYLPNVVFINDEWFICRAMDSETYSSSCAGAIALFLLDFEKHKMYYVGYSKGWLEYEIEYGTFLNMHSCCYRLTKNQEE